MKQRKLLRALCLLLLFSLLTACGTAAEGEAGPTPTPVPTETPAPTPEPEPAAAVQPPEVPEYVRVLMEHMDDYPADTVVATVDGREATWDLYYYWLSDLLATYSAQRGALPEDFTTVINEDVTLEDLARAYADSYTTFYLTLANHAEELGVTLSEEDVASLAARWEQSCSAYGGEEAFQEVLRQSCVTRRTFNFFNSVSLLARNMLTTLYGEEGELVPQEEIVRYVEENELVRAKHILLLSQEDEEANAAVREQMESILAELRSLAGDREALEARFDELAAEYSEDPGLRTNPDGYTFGRGEMVQEFEDAAFALEDYDLSETTETSYGLHVLLRLPIDPDTVMDYDSSYQPYTLRDQVVSQLFSELTEQWATEAEVVTDEAFEDFSLQAMFYPESIGEAQGAEGETEDAAEESAETPQETEESADTPQEAAAA